MDSENRIEIINYNGEGEWSLSAVLERYRRYCNELSIEQQDLYPVESIRGVKKWIYPVMDKVIKGIEQGDKACKLIGIEFIEQDQKFPFGRILKSNTARALRRAELSEEDKARIRRRIVHMLLVGMVPHEYKEYAKLLKGIGLGKHRTEIEALPDKANPYVMRYVRYLLGT